jgi:outer membrane translocation and assembly module TamA
VKKLVAGASITVTGYAKGNAAVANSRATAVVNFLKKRVAIHVKIKTVTRTTMNQVTVVTTYMKIQGQ